MVCPTPLAPGSLSEGSPPSAMNPGPASGLRASAGGPRLARSAPFRRPGPGAAPWCARMRVGTRHGPARHERVPPTALLLGDGRGEKAIRLVSRCLRVREPAGGNKPRQNPELLHQLVIELTPTLVGWKQCLPVCQQTQRVRPTSRARGCSPPYSRSRRFANPTMAPPPRLPFRLIDVGSAWKAQCAKESPSMTSRGRLTTGTWKSCMGAAWQRSRTSLLLCATLN